MLQNIKNNKLPFSLNFHIDFLMFCRRDTKHDTKTANFQTFNAQPEEERPLFKTCLLYRSRFNEKCMMNLKVICKCLYSTFFIKYVGNQEKKLFIS